MSAFAIFDASGFVVQMFDDVDAAPIPAGAVPISDEDRDRLVGAPGHWTWTDGTLAAYEPPPPPPVVPDIISDRQFFQQLANDGDITENEALAYVSVGTLPKRLADAIARLPAADQFPAKMQIIGAKQFLRSNPLTALLGQMLGKDADALDRVWKLASDL